MKLDKVAGSGNDEFYTPEYAILPLLPYLKPFNVIWCPFDTLQSNFVKCLTDHGHKVIYTHISNGENFFMLNKECDAIVSNPPYSFKTEVIERLFQIGKPFAMLMGIVGVFESQRRFNAFRTNGVEVLYFNKRVSYYTSYEAKETDLEPPFSSAYICHGVLPKQIEFAEITKDVKKKRSINNVSQCMISLFDEVTA